MAALAGCAPSLVEALPPPAPISSSQSTSTSLQPPVSTTGPAGDQTTTTLTPVLGPGQASLSGTVTDPTGAAVGGATVEVQRLVGYLSATAMLTTGADGTWTLPNILGGRYRVLAWRAPDLALPKADVFFLNDGSTQNLQLALSSYTGVQVADDIAPNPPIVGQPAQLVVQITSPGVDRAGKITYASAAGTSVTLTGVGSWTVAAPNPATADSSGQVTWTLTCQAPGAQGLTVTVAGGAPMPVNVPPCVGPPLPPPTTTTTFPSGLFGPSTTGAGPSTTVFTPGVG